MVRISNKKGPTNFKKWDMFESSEESEKESEPILPDNDPQFKAMEADMLERKKARGVARKEALALKEQGNFALKK
jgi:hypothetical protein